MKLIAGQSTFGGKVAADGAEVESAATRDGATFTADWYLRQVMLGRVFSAMVGALSTPVVGGGNGTVIDLDQPEFGLACPATHTFVPLLIRVQLTTPLAATDADEAETVAYLDLSGKPLLDGTWTTTITPINRKTACGISSVCTVKSACTADTTDPTESMDLFHTLIVADMNGTPANAMWTKNEILYEPNIPYFVQGATGMFIHWGGTVATSGFAQVSWAEIPVGETL
jgi:hypothetical protein